MKNTIKDIKYDDKGLVPAVIQDIDTGEVLMLGYMNEKAINLTLEGPDVWFYSRSRQEMWHKGETSGNFLKSKKSTKTATTTRFWSRPTQSARSVTPAHETVSSRR